MTEGRIQRPCNDYNDYCCSRFSRFYKRHVDLLKTQLLFLLWSFVGVQERLFAVVLNGYNENFDHNVT